MISATSAAITVNTPSYVRNSIDNPSDLRKIIFNAGFEASMEYAEPKKNRVHKIQLLFSPFGLPFVPIEIIGSDVGSVISSLSWSKDRSNPGGTLGVTITPDAKLIQDIVNILNKFSFNYYTKIWGELGVDLEDLFKPMTLCQFWMDGYHVMTGTVKSCTRSASVQNDSKSVMYSLAIEELGNFYDNNILSMSTLIFDNFVLNKSNDLFSLTASANIKMIPLSEGIKTLATAFLTTLLNSGVSLSDGFPLFMRMLAVTGPFGGLSNLSFAQNMIVDSTMFELNGGQSFWGFLKNFIPNPWMELFTESGGRTMVIDKLGSPSILMPGFNYLVSRSVPYSNPLLGIVNPAHYLKVLPFDLDTINLLIGGDFIIITDDDISEKNLGFDSSNQSTVFHTRYSAGSSVMPMDNNDYPIHSVGPMNPLASGGISTFGRRDMFQQINCTHLLNIGISASYVDRIASNTLGLDLTKMSKPALSNLLAVWFRNQSRFREGSVTTRSIPYARAGMYCLYIPSLSGKKPENLRDIGIYYIDSLSHSYSLQNQSVSNTTTLNLIRGVPLPMSIAQTALLLFDFELLPPEIGFGTAGEEYETLKTLRNAVSAI